MVRWRRRKGMVLYYRKRICLGDVLFYGSIILLALAMLAWFAFRCVHGLVP